MKKYAAGLLIVVMTLSMLMNIGLAKDYTINDIQKEFPGGERKDDTLTVTYLNCPELAEGNNWLSLILSNGKAPFIIMAIGYTDANSTANKLTVKTKDVVYDLEFAEPTKKGKGATLICLPVGKLAQLIPDILNSEEVEISLRNSVSKKDDVFMLNDAQRKLIDMAYSCLIK